MNQIDKNGEIFDKFDKLKKKHRKIITTQVMKRTKWQDTIIKKSFPYLRLNESLPSILNLLDIEREVFYLIHFACFYKASKCEDKIILPHGKIVMTAM